MITKRRENISLRFFGDLIMGSVSKRIKRNMIENKYRIRTSVNKLKKMKKIREEKAKKKEEEMALWDKIKNMGKE